MKNVFLLLAATFLLFSCDEKPVIIKDSAGRINDILVVASNENWEGEVGDSIRSILARPIDGIIRDEPLFTLNHIKPKAFSGMLRKNRNYLMIKTGDSARVTVKKDIYANPQLGVIVQGSNAKTVAKVLGENADNMISVFSKGEVAWKNYLMRKTKLNTERVKEMFGINITIPRTYHYAKNRRDDDFLWIRRGIEEGTMDIMIYEVDYDKIARDENTVQDIIAVRDSVGAIKIPVNEPGVFQTVQDFTPFLNETQIDGKFAFETKGNWEVKNLWMAGPFINYAVYNQEKNNWLILEGYVSAPNSTQRNYLFELEAILRSVNFADASSSDEE